MNIKELSLTLALKYYRKDGIIILPIENIIRIAKIIEKYLKD